MIIAVCHRKGGTGKTTVSTGIACELERLGYATLLVDADPQGTATDWRAAAERESHLPTVVALAKDTMHRKGQIDRISEKFDFTVIDCPPALGAITRSALMTANVAVVPSRPNAADLWALEDTLTVFLDAQAFNVDLQGFVLITQKPVNSRGADAGERVLRELVDEAGLVILSTVLHQRVDYPNSMLDGSYPGEYKPREKAAKEVKKLVAELLEACDYDQ